MNAKSPRLVLPKLLLATLCLALLAGCESPAQPRSPSPFAACPPSVSEAGSLPAVTLPCFTGDVPVALDRLGVPAVINLWASWCAPCLAEMPALQAFADETQGQVLVLGVATEDRWESAVAWAGELGVTYPNVYDPAAVLKAELGLPMLPATLFVAADGTVRHTEVASTLTLERLRALAAEHLG